MPSKFTAALAVRISAEAEQLRDFVERFAGRVIAGLAEQAIDEILADLI